MTVRIFRTRFGVDLAAFGKRPLAEDDRVYLVSGIRKLALEFKLISLVNLLQGVSSEKEKRLIIRNGLEGSRKLFADCSKSQLRQFTAHVATCAKLVTERKMDEKVFQKIRAAFRQLLKYEVL